MRNTLLIPLFFSTLVTGCATPISNNTLLENEESIIMLCKTGAPFILTQQVQISPEVIIVKSLPVPKKEECALIKNYDPEVLITNISTNNSNKDRARVDVYKSSLLPGNLINDERKGYKVKLTANAINYIGHVNFDSFDGKDAQASFSDNLKSAKGYLAKKAITKFPVVKSLPIENL
jgi:hypothetical protein